MLPQVILIVDKVLETQDLNGDGLMTPAELINFPGQPLELQDVGRQSLFTENSPRQETQEALGPKEEAGGQVEARRESLEPVQEAKGQAEAGGEAPVPEVEAEGQAEAGEAPGPEGEAGGQAEARDTREEAKELPEETLEFKNTPNGFEVHAIQMENDEI